jgi:enoyl-CoA hydratase
MSLEGYSRFTFARSGRVLTATITGNNPVNGVDALMHDELARVFTDLQHDANSDIIVLTGAGRAFCAGGDFAWFEEQIADPRKFRDIGWDAKRIVTSLLDVEKPVICRLNGAAAGLGATIALLCDIIIADENAVIGDPHVKVGLVAGDGGAVIWPQLIGYARAKEFLMTGDLIKAPRAEAMGLINYSVPGDQLDAKVTELVGKLMGKAFIQLAPLLGYQGSMFNLVFASNVASIQLWRSLGFKEIGRLPKAGRLKSQNELVDAIMFYYDFNG